MRKIKVIERASAIVIVADNELVFSKKTPVFYMVFVVVNPLLERTAPMKTKIM